MCNGRTVGFMLTVYARHVEACETALKAKGLSPAARRSWRRCGCPLWVMGNDPRGEFHRHSLNTTNWQTAESEKRRIESGAAARIEIGAALDGWQAALRGAKRAERTVKHVHGAMARSLQAWCDLAGYVHLDALTTDVLDEWVGGWEYASTTHRARIDLARSFFKFCIARKWTRDNPASGLLKPKNEQEPTLPFTAEEEARLFEAATRFGERPHFDGLWAMHPETARALLYVMRFTGLRASDSVAFEPRAITTQNVDGRDIPAYATYQTKTKEWVFCPIPPAVAAIITAAPRLCEARAFIPPAEWGMNTDGRSVSNGFYSSYLLPLGILAGVTNVHAHRLRDTFAVRLLEAGKPLEIVQALLGHSSIKTTEQHYAPWVKSRQEMLIREVVDMWD